MTTTIRDEIQNLRRSITEDIKYWRRVRKEVKRYSLDWYRADATIKVLEDMKSALWALVKGRRS